MKTKSVWLTAAVMALAVPAWAHCGFCGKGDEKGEEHKHEHAEIGKPAPDFVLKDIDGKEHKLSDLKGKVVVLEWINHECPVVNRCHKAGIIKETREHFADEPVVWLAIDSSHFANDKLEKIRKWADEQEIQYPYLLDAPGKVGHLYGARTTPQMFVIDKKGILVYAGAIDDDPYGQEEESTNYVVEAVEAVLKGSTVAKAETKPYGCSVKYKK